ncbi:MAG: ABC transporter substrate-binding protein [Erythrobacter sp.]|uniref:ABC transporter substrate-binding protein n=1 Tax=Erythrobacter sp. TaxID=1042 RepID=UPI001B0A0707|nr:helical backbone metal receptor [Erythrobacter sp.]MBO6769249.1 ABC transporter substrate-binding protein [Erythrobacter sp.]
MSALVLLLSACAGEGPARVGGEEGGGERPTIVSLNPCSDAVLAEVAAPGQLLAISHYSKDPRSSSMDMATAARFPATGGTVEEVLALDPDVVVAGGFLAPATRAAFADLGIEVVTFGIAGDVAASMQQVRDLASLAGDVAAGERLIDTIEEALAEARPAGDERAEVLLWQPGGIVAGEQALVSDLLARTGFENVAPSRGLSQADYVALEDVVAAPPRVLLVAGSQMGQRHPVLNALPDMRREHFDTGLLYCGGPTIIRAVERLAEIREAAS